MSLFTKPEADRVAALISEVETRTAGEIVVAEEARSDDYAEIRVFWAFGLALAASGAGHLLQPHWEAGVLLALQLAIALAVWLLSALPGVLRLLVPRGRAAEAVQKAAQLAFVEHAVFRTRDRTGVLIFLSALEHRVVILGDQGIHQRVQEPGWDALVGQLVKAMREGRAGEGVCAVVQQLGERLTQDAPIRPDDENELPNYVRGPHAPT
jgi:putative membrane protein